MSGKRTGSDNYTIDLTLSDDDGGVGGVTQVGAEFGFAFPLGSPSGFDFGSHVATDASGNVYVTGLFSGTADFDPGGGVQHIGSAGSWDAFVSKLEQPTASPVVTVHNVAPTADLNNNGPVAEGSLATVSFANPSDPSPLDVAAGFRYGFSLSPGGLPASYASAGASTSQQFTFDDNGAYSVGGRVFDDDEGFNDYQTTVTLADLAPTADFNWTPDPQAEGAAIGFRDLSTSSPDAIVGWSWDFAGLGTSTDPNPDFTFFDNGSYLVTLTVTDDDGSTDDVIHAVTVNNVAPTADLGNDSPKDEGSVVASDLDDELVTELATDVNHNGKAKGK